MEVESFLLRIVTPFGVLLEEQAVAATLPSASGEIGVYPGHEAYTCNAGIGLAHFSSFEIQETRHFVVKGGFFRFCEGTLEVLADAAYLSDQVKGLDFEQERNRLLDKVTKGDPTKPDWQLSKDRLAEIDAIQALARI